MLSITLTNAACTTIQPSIKLFILQSAPAHNQTLKKLNTHYANMTTNMVNTLQVKRSDNIGLKIPDSFEPTDGFKASSMSSDKISKL